MRTRRRERLLQWFRRALLMVSLGLVTTIAVAWGLAAFLPHRHLIQKYNVIQYTDAAGRIKPTWTETLEVHRPGMIRRVWVTGPPMSPRPAGWASLAKDAATQLGYRPLADRSWGDLPRELAREGASPGSGMDDARGWPWPALWCALDAAGIDGGTTTHPVSGGFRISRISVGSARYRALPLIPAWRGLALDTLVFALCIALLAVSARYVRSHWRRVRGWCPRCAYDLKRDLRGGCPECGWNRASSEGRSEQSVT